MNEILSRAARLLQNPEIIRSLPKALTDPKALGSLAGLGAGRITDDKLKLLSGIGNSVSGLIKGLTTQARSSHSPVRSVRTSMPAGVSTCKSTGGKGTAIAGTVSLTAITGAVVVVGAVSAVALAKGSKVRP
jgi:hypothetical protein